jgi:hypothetical protein
MEHENRVSVPRWELAEVQIRAQDIAEILTKVEEEVGPPESVLAGLLRAAKDHAQSIANLIGDE